MASNLIPKIDKLIDSELNVFLIGRHGVGKTVSLMDAAKRHKLKVAYYSCSTLDPWTDLVGVPYPREIGDGVRDLEMVRPHAIDEAEIIMLDEINRAQDDKTLNSLLEIIQFGTINGEKLPNHKATWAAANPIDDDMYQVRELDPALIDRFDVYHELRERVSVDYMQQSMSKEIATTMAKWWNDRRKENKKADYISPRRVEKIGALVYKMDDPTIAKMMMPPGGKYDVTKLIEELKVAMGHKARPVTNAFQAPDDSTLTYTSAWFKKNTTQVKSVLQGTPSESTVDQICDVLRKNIGGFELGDKKFRYVLDEIPLAKLEPLIKGYSYAKRRQITQKLPKDTNTVTNLRKALTAAGSS